MKSLTWMLALLALASCGGARTPPNELVNARAELVRAKQGPAAQLDPTDVHEAELALNRAEKAWGDDPDSPVTLDLAVIAQLKAQSAEATAGAMQATNQASQAQRDLQAWQSDQLRAARGELSQTRGDLNKTREDLSRQTQETEAERKKRLDLEKQLQNARDTLARIAAVKDDDRGMVVTFQGETLFKTGKSDLLPAAMVKLDQVADTLKGQERKILVVGHTDNQGGAGQYNQTLSEKRASAVRDYLVSKGIPQDLITAEGRGPSQPVADNTSIEGRAANRRVEIIVQPKAK
jgi:outer membrane protein OmpA-like peptidoglycan-associated protein